jgi:hypothetical protein
MGDCDPSARNYLVCGDRERLCIEANQIARFS